MNISSLNKKILIEKNCTVVDENANHINKFYRYYECFSTISSANNISDETVMSGISTNTEKLTLYIRYSSEVKDLDTTHFRLNIDGVFYNILSIDNMKYKGEMIKLLCQREALQHE